MRRFIMTFSLFALFSIAVYVACIFVTGSFLPRTLKPNMLYQLGSTGHLNSRIKEADTLTGGIDILFLGSSHSYRGIDTRLFKGFRSFNLGSSSQSPLQTAVLLDRYLGKFSPKLIVYEVYPYPLTTDGVESSVDLISNSRNDFEVLDMSFKVNHVKVYNTLIYGVTRDLLNMNASFNEPLSKRGDTYIPGGFVEKQIKYFKHESYPEKKSWQLNEKQLAAFQGIIEKIRKKNIRLMLVYAPITSALYNSYDNNGYIDSLMNAYSNGNYVNFNGRINLDDSLHFYNSHHLNQKGVEIFNHELLADVEKFYASQGLTRKQP